MMRRCKRILEFPLSASISLQQPDGQKYFPHPAPNMLHGETTLAGRCVEIQKGLICVGDSAEYLAAPST